MDDYLAKPVRGKVLEKMLLKWAMEGRRRERKKSQESESGVDGEKDRGSSLSTTQTGGDPSSQPTNSTASSNSWNKTSWKQKQFSGTELANTLTRLDYAETTVLNKASETTSQRHTRRLETEEKAASLRDDKFLSVSIPSSNDAAAASGSPGEKESGYREDHASHPLTLGNLERHSSQQKIEGEGMLPRSPNEKSRRSRLNRHTGSTEAEESASDSGLEGEKQGEVRRSRTRPKRRNQSKSPRSVETAKPFSPRRPDLKGTRKNESESTLRNMSGDRSSEDSPVMSAALPKHPNGG